MSGSGRIRVAIHIDVIPGEAGGTAQSTLGLVHSLGQLDGPEQYLLSAQTPQQLEWISRFHAPNQRSVLRHAKWSRHAGANLHGEPRTLGDRLKALLRPTLENIRWATGRLSPQNPVVPISNGYYESLGCDVLHFPTQLFELCALPTIYNPHDLQHLHYPQFFGPHHLAWRETVYRAACHFSRTVVVGSEWIKQDVIQQYGVHPDKVQVIPWAPPTAQYPEIDVARIEETRRRLNLPATYAFFPAVTWPHKNHLRLLEALAELRDHRGLLLNLVCSGAKYESHWPNIDRRIQELNLAAQVKFLGFLSEADLRTVYRLAQFLVLPSLFEADSCPIHEAWTEGIPVASSNHTGLPDQVGDAGLLFDAADVPATADALARMATDASLRRRLRELGYLRVNDFSWERTAKAFRAVYRRAAGVPLDDEDRWLLAWDWMREPRRRSLCQETHA
jgi:glycosyltransferase involved in cell wall biosynthesis